jgi:hypothetical protein
MGSEPPFTTVPHQGPLRSLWQALADSGCFGRWGRLWFSTLADTDGARRQVRLAREDHDHLRTSKPYSVVLQAILDDPDCRLVDRDPAQGEQQLIHAACFDATWIQLRGSALDQARYLRLYCVSRFRPFRRVYTYDLAANEICRHGLPGGQWHREVPYALW